MMMYFGFPKPKICNINLVGLALILLWVSYGPIIKIANDPGSKKGMGLFYKALVPITILYFTMIFWVVNFLLSIVIKLDLSLVAMVYMHLTILLLGLMLEIYVLRSNGLKKIMLATSQTDLLKKISKICMSTNFAVFWWAFIVCAVFSVIFSVNIYR